VLLAELEKDVEPEDVNDRETVVDDVWVPEADRLVDTVIDDVAEEDADELNESVSEEEPVVDDESE
jgi:hypothetical protein